MSCVCVAVRSYHAIQFPLPSHRLQVRHIQVDVGDDPVVQYKARPVVDLLPVVVLVVVVVRLARDCRYHRLGHCCGCCVEEGDRRLRARRRGEMQCWEEEGGDREKVTAAAAAAAVAAGARSRSSSSSYSSSQLPEDVSNVRHSPSPSSSSSSSSSSPPLAALARVALKRPAVLLDVRAAVRKDAATLAAERAGADADADAPLQEVEMLLLLLLLLLALALARMSASGRGLRAAAAARRRRRRRRRGRRRGRRLGHKVRSTVLDVRWFETRDAGKSRDVVVIVVPRVEVFRGAFLVLVVFVPQLVLSHVEQASRVVLLRRGAGTDC